MTMQTTAKSLSSLTAAGHTVLAANQGTLAALERVQMDMCDPDWAERGSLVERLIEERGRLTTAIGLIPGLNPLPSEANFLLVKTVVRPRRLFEELLDRDILVRDVSHYPMLSDHLRLSVGRPEENDAVVSALQGIMSKART